MNIQKIIKIEDIGNINYFTEINNEHLRLDRYKGLISKINDLKFNYFSNFILFSFLVDKVHTRSKKQKNSEPAKFFRTLIVDVIGKYSRPEDFVVQTIQNLINVELHEIFEISTDYEYKVVRVHLLIINDILFDKVFAKANFNNQEFLYDLHKNYL